MEGQNRKETKRKGKAKKKWQTKFKRVAQRKTCLHLEKREVKNAKKNLQTFFFFLLCGTRRALQRGGRGSAVKSKDICGRRTREVRKKITEKKGERMSEKKHAMRGKKDKHNLTMPLKGFFSFFMFFFCFFEPRLLLDLKQGKRAAKGATFLDSRT